MQIQITSIDFYLCKPHDQLDQSSTQFQVNSYNLRVPVLRLFGSLPAGSGGQKVCLHIHQVYPYIYINMPVTLNQLGDAGLGKYINQLGHSLNAAINCSFNSNNHINDGNMGEKEFIMSIHLVKGIPFYGFSTSYQYFLKIYLLNPQLQTREDGAAMNQRFQVYDHYQYVQQFMIDYNLAGMDLIELDYYKIRLPILPVARVLNVEGGSKPIDASFLNPDNSWIDTPIKRTSYCELEIDTWPCNITNRLKVKERPYQALVTRQTYKDKTVIASDVPLVPSLAAVWIDEVKRRVTLGLDQYIVPTKSSQKRNEYTPWKSEEKFRSVLHDAIEKAKNEKINQKSSLTETEKQDSLFQNLPDDEIPTAFQGISLLHPPKRTFASSTVVEYSSSRLVSSSQHGHIFSSSQMQKSECGGEESEAIFDKSICTQTQRELEKISTQEAIEILQGLPDDEDFDSDKEEEIAITQHFKVNPAPVADDLFDGLLEEMQGFAEYFDDDDGVFVDDNREEEAELERSESPILTSCLSKKRQLDYFDIDGQDNNGANHRLKRPRIPQFDGAFDTPPKKKTSRRNKKVRFISPSLRFEPYFDTKRPVEFDVDSFPGSMLKGVYRGGLWSPAQVKDPIEWAFHSAPPRPISPNFKVVCPSTPPRPLSSDHPAVTLLSTEVVGASQDYSFDCARDVTLEEGADEPRSKITLNLFDEDDFGGNDIAFDDADEALPSYQITGNEKLFKYAPDPPAASALLSTLDPAMVYQEPFVSKRQDAPKKIVMNRKEYQIGDNMIASIPPFKMNHNLYQGLEFWNKKKKANKQPLSLSRKRDFKIITPAINPPSFASVSKWLKEAPKKKPDGYSKAQVSQLEHPTFKNPQGVKFSQSQIASINVEKQNLILLSLEVHVQTNTVLLPNPAKDPIAALFYCVQSDQNGRLAFGRNSGEYHVGIIAVKDHQMDMTKTGLKGYDLTLVANEQELFDSLVRMVRTLDPDILCGWEIHKASWGYVFERAKNVANRDLCLELSRILPEFSRAHTLKEEDEWGFHKQSSLHTPGRIFLNVWRIMRKELTLTSYSLENVIFHVLHHRAPKFSHESLSQWYKNGMLLRWRTLQHYMDRAKYSLDLLSRIEWISQTSEFARVYGILLFSVAIRGSQFKVESVMARIARPENFVINSPSRKRVRFMRPAKSIALNKEPVSQLYTSPLVVLDFQSLYPSLMIAYNYCYSTFLGYAGTTSSGGAMGALESYMIDPDIVEMLKDDVNVAPNGMVFVKPHIRQGVLGRMVGEILDTRIMVKSSMKLYKESKGLTRVLHAKQLGLKLLANVTYGYTASSFTGRMPCSELADAIVESGRCTLERCIEFIQTRPQWSGCKVVYADTDSLFVSMPGKSKDQAFEVGYEIKDAITLMNPVPVRLQFEKVYLPCILLAKKRYVGFKYEGVGDTEPGFDAKGIETVRRDGCPVAAKCLETSLKILFRTKDISLVKEYLQRQWGKISSGRVSKQDFVIAKEVKLGQYKNVQSEPNGAFVSREKMARDEMAEPEYGDRVGYIVVNRGGCGTLRNSCVSPEQAVTDPSLQINAEYYITKQIIAPLHRVFSLMGVDVAQWYNEMPKISRAIAYDDNDTENTGPQKTIDLFFKSKLCVVCETSIVQDSKLVCGECRGDPASRLKIEYESRQAQDRYRKIVEICRSCTGHGTALDAEPLCISQDCPVYYSRATVKTKFLAQRSRGSQCLDFDF